MSGTINTDFNSELGSIDDNLLNQLFEDAPIEGTPNADDLAVGKTTPVETSNIEKLDETLEDELFGEDKTPEQLAEEKVKAEEATKAKEIADTKEKEAKAKEEANKNKTPEQLETEKKEEEAKAKKKDEEEAAKPTPEVIEALTNTVAYLIKAGNWVDFEGREGLEITPEIYENLVVAQDKLRLSAQFDELVDSTGDYGKAIIAHIKQGGNPDDVIDIFKEQQQVEAIKTDTEDGKQAVIEKYYKDIMGWGDAKVQKHVKRLIADEEIESEFTEVKDLYDKHYKQRLEAIDKEAKEQSRIAEERKDQFKVSIKTALEKDNTFTTQERKLIEDAILNFKHDIGGGQRVNDFYIKFAEMQKDPSQYIELVRFVMDPKNYKKAIAQTEETKAAKKTFTFIKANASVKKVSTNAKNSKESGSQSGGTNFSFK